MIKVVKKIKSCEVCGKALKKNILDLGSHPMCDDLIQIGSKKKSKLYPLVLNICEYCLTVAQQFHINQKKLFPKKYHYRARFTKDVISGQKNLVQRTEQLFGPLKNKYVLDIGANDFSLLNIFKKIGAKTIGVEPTNAIKDASKNHIKYQSYFNKKIALKIKKNCGVINFITFTNVFAHINDFKKLLSNLKILLTNDTVLIVENHYLGSVLKEKQFDTFYSEHLRTYSFQSFIYIAKFLKLNISFVEFPKRYGGNIRVFLTKNKNLVHLSPGELNKTLKKEKKFLKDFKNIKHFINKWKIRKRKKILDLNKKFGALEAKAFPGRAAIILKILGLNQKNISGIYEKPLSKKIGFYAPGTNIPILSDRKLSKVNKNKPIINLAWHIKKEIKKYMRSAGINNKIIDVLEKRDFT